MISSGSPIENRKDDHLRIVAEKDVRYQRGTLLNHVHLIHNSLPELCMDEIEYSMTFFGKTISAPLMIASMTGGTDKGFELNCRLAAAAASAGIPLALGSQRVMLEQPATRKSFDVRSYIPDGILLGNIGARQLVNATRDQIRFLVDAISGDGLCIHLNAAQEMAQDEGDRDFRGLLNGIADAVEILDGRVLVKETGSGLSPAVVQFLISVGVVYIDVSGVGGTSWIKVEKYRGSDLESRSIAETFGEWGIPTAAAVAGARRVAPECRGIIASGGIETGLDVARSIALGADLTALARPFLLADNHPGGIEKFIYKIIAELKSAMLLTGSCTLTDLRNAPRVITGDLDKWMALNT